jgi:hypothetical protein
VEVAVAEYLRTLVVVKPVDDEAERPMKLMKLMETLWEPDESDRFVVLAETQRWLLNIEEEHRWKRKRAWIRRRSRGSRVIRRFRW